MVLKMNEKYIPQHTICKVKKDPRDIRDHIYKNNNGAVHILFVLI